MHLPSTHYSNSFRTTKLHSSIFLLFWFGVGGAWASLHTCWILNRLSSVKCSCRMVVADDFKDRVSEILAFCTAWEEVRVSSNSKPVWGRHEVASQNHCLLKSHLLKHEVTRLSVNWYYIPTWNRNHLVSPYHSTCTRKLLCLHSVLSQTTLLWSHSPNSCLNNSCCPLPQ